MFTDDDKFWSMTALQLYKRANAHVVDEDETDDEKNAVDNAAADETATDEFDNPFIERDAELEYAKTRDTMVQWYIKNKASKQPWAQEAADFLQRAHRSGFLKHIPQARYWIASPSFHSIREKSLQEQWEVLQSQKPKDASTQTDEPRKRCRSEDSPDPRFPQ